VSGVIVVARGGHGRDLFDVADPEDSGAARREDGASARHGRPFHGADTSAEKTSSAGATSAARASAAYPFDHERRFGDEFTSLIGMGASLGELVATGQVSSG
jgi:hypothetical protein